MKFKLIQYDNPESLLAEYSDLKVDEIDWKDKETKKVISAIKKNKYWGFIYPDNSIHFWFKEGLPLKSMIEFFGHEIGHATGKQLKGYQAEEDRADTYMSVAIKAYELAIKIKNKG